MASSRPLIPNAGAPLVVRPATSFLALTSATGQLEWDGARLFYKQGLRRRELVRLGDGKLLRLTHADALLGGGGRRLVWVGPDGIERADMIESQWPIREVLDLAALARVPVIDLGEISYRELYDRYPAMAPRIGGMDPSTPVTWGMLRDAVLHRGADRAGRRLTARDRIALIAVLAVGGSWFALRALGAIG